MATVRGGAWGKFRRARTGREELRQAYVRKIYTSPLRKTQLWLKAKISLVLEMRFLRGRMSVAIKDEMSRRRLRVRGDFRCA